MSGRTLLLGAGRQTGRTTRAIRLASAFGATLVVPDANRVQFIEQMARRMNVTVNVRTWDEVVARPPTLTGVIIDDADSILERMLGCNLSAITVNAAPMEGGPDGR